MGEEGSKPAALLCLYWLVLVQVTKLCDLGAGDSVCSVSWSQRGTYLSVGTNTGEVQVGAGWAGALGSREQQW